MGVQHLPWILLMLVVVLAEYQGKQVALFVQYGELVQFMVPDDIVGLAQAYPLTAIDDRFPGGHEAADRRFGIQAGDPVIPAGHDTDQFPV